MKGSFYKRGSTWSYLIDIGKDPKTGKRVQKGKGGFKTKKAAQDAAADIISNINRGTFVKEIKMDFEELSRQWLEHYSKHGKPKKDGTIRIRSNERDSLLTCLAKLITNEISHDDYQNALIKLKDGDYDENGDAIKKPLAYNTLSGVHSTGGMIFKYGLKIGAVKSDPTANAYVPKSELTVEELEKNEEIPNYLEKEELIQFLNTARTHGLDKDFETFSTLAYTGMRVGELCAFKETDIDFVDHKIRITKTLYNPNNNYKKYKLNTPKTPSSIRDIDVEPEIIDGFNNLLTIQKLEKAKRPDIFHDKGFVFAKTGQYAGYPEVIKMVELRMKRLLKLAGLNQELTPHSLRHTHTSLLAEAGVSLEQIMHRLGHADDVITRKIYLHITKPKRKEASQKFGELMRASKKIDPELTNC
ncbi:site-specific integrase [Paenibacillus sp. UMB4589-SE434]|uniref:tyrosine-type recombinase/integrase n=1 Tax=Paenibacillus sp. UMB4589-SE434 TaxID=3046314 RepID=UPI00254CFCD5|nr:site-specific integrase [Paenibacillus sp. UMB4589-SE434]MDK8182066.1 site-specific integrase [Paenibacillus sp. UMB4589-SE434]